ncbi:hypothetical protein B0H12DRAFT_394046 [Mycena haematopus]|nr:hypothetical protein B0H12DRAFT_394046 [Mycena haematopus]
MLIARCPRRVPLRLHTGISITSRSKTTTAELAFKAGADLSSPREFGIFPPTPVLRLAPEQAELLGHSMVQAIRCYNRRPCKRRIIFYHEPRSQASDENFALLEAIHRNAKGHLAPLRFTLEVREGMPSADTFHELLYQSGGTSLSKLFVLPEHQHRHYIPNVPALLELLSKDPLLLNVPILRYSENDTVEGRLFHGRSAVPDLLKLMELPRSRTLGVAKSTILNRLAIRGDWQSINRGPRLPKISKTKGKRLER